MTPSSHAHRRLNGPERARLLRRVVEDIQQHPTGSRLVVFDLDGTLLDNRPRSCVIAHELGAAWSQSHPREAELLRAAHFESFAYLFEDNLRALGLGDAGLIAEGVAFWKERFFTDAFLAHDEPLSGACEFARACYAAGATLVYFTGRDLPNMALGSLASLRDHGFPIGVPGTELVLKPDAATSDSDYKRQLAPDLRRHGVIAAAFDNEPLNCNIFKQLYPETETFLVDTQHPPGAPALDPGVHVIDHFSMDP